MAALPLVIPLLLNIRKRLSLWLEERALLLQKHTEDQVDVVQADHTELKLIQPFKEQRGHSVVQKRTNKRTNEILYPKETGCSLGTNHIYCSFSYKSESAHKSI